MTRLAQQIEEKLEEYVGIDAVELNIKYSDGSYAGVHLLMPRSEIINLIAEYEYRETRNRNHS